MSESEQPGGQRPEPEQIRESLEVRMEAIRRGIGGFFPPEFRDHYRAARREFWLAVRSLVDARLDAIEGEAQPRRQPPSGRIDVE